MPNLWNQFDDDQLRRVYPFAKFDDKASIIHEQIRRREDPYYRERLNTKSVSED